MATLAAGTRIGTYEVTGPLGAGGMGEVYRARDSRLQREVAIKLLPEDVAQDPERLARFEREARLLAAVHHAHVATLFGLEEIEGRRVLVMECVAGETLAQRIAKGPLPVAEAVAICRQIALGLEAAHEAGIIHRDLKPANVMITPDGDAKVLDFGLARGGMTASTSSTSADLTHSPTMSVMGTAAGVILGTAAYMSPEQARGRPVDRRTDVWAFGCVLYECLTGRQAFTGETISDIVARILEREPDWASLPANVSPELREVLANCLAKDPRARTRDIGDARLAMERALNATVARPRAAGFPWVPVAAALVVGVLGTFLAMRAMRPAVVPQVSHVSIEIPAGLRATSGFGVLNGRGLIFVARPKDSSDAQPPAVYLRPFDRHEAIKIEGTEGVRDGAGSPNGRWLAFQLPAPGDPARSRLMRKSMGNDSPIVDLGAWDESWNSMAVLDNGDVLLLTRDGTSLTRVTGAGNRTAPAKVDLGGFRGFVYLRDALPGDRSVLLDRTGYADQGWTQQTAVLDLKTNRVQVVVERGSSPSYDGRGHLLFARNGQLLAVSFDPGRMTTHGEPAAVMDGLRVGLDLLRTDYTLDRSTGNLYFQPGGVLMSQRYLGLVDDAGKYRRLPFEARAYHTWILGSADGSRFVTRVLNSELIDEAWIGELSPPALRRRISLQSADVVAPALSPDGSLLAYYRVGRDSLDGIYVAEVDGSGPGVRIIAPDSSGAALSPTCWSPDGQFLLFDRRVGGGPGDIVCAKLNATGDAIESLVRLTETPANEFSAVFSPDMRWVMYGSNEAGRSNVYVAPFDPAIRLGRPTRLNSELSSYPSWMSDGKEIVIRPTGGPVLRAPISLSGKPTLGPARPWFDATHFLDNEVIGDRQALIVEKAAGETEDFTAVDVILGWGQTLPDRIRAAQK